MWPFATGLGKLTPPVALLPAGEAQPVEVGCELDGPGDNGVDDDGDQFIDELPWRRDRRAMRARYGDCGRAALVLGGGARCGSRARWDSTRLCSRRSS